MIPLDWRHALVAAIVTAIGAALEALGVYHATLVAAWTIIVWYASREVANVECRHGFTLAWWEPVKHWTRGETGDLAAAVLGAGVVYGAAYLATLL